MDAPEELELTDLTTDEYQSKVSGAFETAGSQGKITYLTEHGERVAVIAPVEAGEHYEQRMTVAVAGRHHRS
jgi:hypothetical protein